MQVLFLDFDGVLNNTEFYEREAARRKSLPLDAPYCPRDDFDPENMAQLTALATRLPDLNVVISSSWRKGRTLGELRDYLAPAFTRNRILGVTPNDSSRLRHIEITRWIEESGLTVDRFLGIDDDTFDMAPLGENFLHIHRSKGLTAAHVDAIVDHFTRSRKV